MQIWLQTSIFIRARRRGFQLITREVLAGLESLDAAALRAVEIGQLHLFLKHTSAALTINENADPDVRDDLETAFNRIAPENAGYVHTCEGPDDMPAHVKSSVLGCSLLIPIRAGGLELGTWQGIYLCEHRDHPTSREIVLTVHGQSD